MAHGATRRPRKRAQTVPFEPIPLRCDVCGADAIAAEPGTEETHELFLLNRGAPLRRWCATHWPWLASTAGAAA